MVYTCILILVNYNKNSDKGMQHILLQDLAIGKVTSEDSGNLFYFNVAPYRPFSTFAWKRGSYDF